MNTVKREFAVALSKRAQPIWFRIAKWIVLIGVALVVWKTPYFWPCFGGMTALGLLVHFFYRWKTHGWTRAWGGWNDPTFVQR
ncbi:MAG: hypothetical protein ABIZ81_06300 [Opitutaceae bacterium]